jgi:spoIIIJ-associated protein
LRQELPFRIFVDVSGLRRKREEELIQMAFDLSAKVHENKRPIVLNYKSSYDRKIIHMALDKDERVYTKSIGSGPNRKLMILPQKEGQLHEEPETYGE